MVTPIVMLALMLAPAVLAAAFNGFTRYRFDLRNAAALGLGILFIFTGIGHFAQTGPMVQMLPSWVPERELLVYLSGFLEFAIAIGFFIPRFRRLAGLSAALVLVLFFPVNVYAVFNHVPMGGHAWGPVYLLIRAPLQAIILVWVYWFTIRAPGTASDRRAARTMRA
ncbi:MAG: hypothetical protein A3I66_03905 [Burkholderiales bacterium RIFCSPLOWO2_02_FULL_57_36]|nr:MAG: hypothetical protein A3I66_03905 [Burkholderiales bacterium RIFCSPLOWO2_02_FULL_57_36]